MSNKLDNTAIGQRIKEIRISLGETTEKFSENFDPPASKGTISKWENGRYLPNNKRIKKIAELGEMTIQELLYGSKEVYLKKLLKESVFEDSSYYSDELVNEIIKYLIAHENLDDIVVSVSSSDESNIDISELEKDMIMNFIDNFIFEFVSENNNLDLSNEDSLISTFTNFVKQKTKFDLNTFEGAFKHLTKETEKIDPYYYTNETIQEFLNDKSSPLHSMKSEDELINLYFLSKLNEQINEAATNVYMDYINFKISNDDDNE